MTKAIIFDMYETLITHHNSPLYFGTQIAQDAGIDVEIFLKGWRATDYDRTIGKYTLEEVIEALLKEHHRYSKPLFDKIIAKRIETQSDCFLHLHEEILPMLAGLKEKGIKIGLISNCYSEEAKIIRESALFPYFDSICLSYERGVAKPDKAIFHMCMNELGVKPEECTYVGDGGSYELETARELGMNAMQAVWYLKDGTTQPCTRKQDFVQLENPSDLLRNCH